MSSLPSENTAIVGAATSGRLTLAENAAVASWTATTWNTARCAHGFAVHVVLSFQASMIASAASWCAASMTNGPPR